MYDHHGTIKNLAAFFVENALLFPDRPAIFVDDQFFSYRELLQKAYQLAACLVHYNIYETTPLHCVILTARGIDSYIGLLAILLAGKTCVPLSIKSPPQRNAHILQFSQTKMLIIDTKNMPDAIALLNACQRPLFVFLPNRKTLPIEFTFLPHYFILQDEIDSMPLLRDHITNENAYLLFTSGSTGTPKAVMTRQCSIISYLKHMLLRYQLNENDRFTQLTDLSFDVAFHELFLCWAHGACLYVMHDQHLTHLVPFMHKHQLTYWTSVPSIISLLKQWRRLSEMIFPSIRHTVLLGEPLTEELATFWHAIAPHSHIDNLYGPTEATIIFTGYRWQPSHPHVSGYVPIGKPMPDQRVAILNEHRQPVPPGNIGELYLSGSQVAEGYWRYPAMTAEKFVYIGDDKKNYWYKTGDFVQWEEPFGLIFKGRDIDILKVRGGRIERLEVEMVLRDVAKTNMVAVIPTQIMEEGVVMSLTAFIGYSAVKSPDILKMSRKKLPDYMVPAKIIRVESLPLNKNGKVDYAALQACFEITT